MPESEYEHHFKNPANLHNAHRVVPRSMFDVPGAWDHFGARATTDALPDLKSVYSALKAPYVDILSGNTRSSTIIRPLGPGPLSSGSLSKTGSFRRQSQIK